MQPFAQKLKLEASGDYAMSYAGWSPDYMDPMSFLEMYTTGNAQNKVHYANPAYDDLIKKQKQKLMYKLVGMHYYKQKNNCLKMQRLLRYINTKSIFTTWLNYWPIRT